MLEGRCLPYGKGITYWPLVEIVRGLELDACSTGEPDAETVRGRLSRSSAAPRPTSRSDELYWAVRRLLEILARLRPVVLVLDDVQWAEPAFLDLVEYLVGWSRDAPILVCCLARSDSPRSGPPGPMLRLELAPLAETRLRSLENLAGPLAPRVKRRSAGSPAGTRSSSRRWCGCSPRTGAEGDGCALERALRVPATVQAVLAARLDRLEPEERALLQRAAVIGQVLLLGRRRRADPARAGGRVARPPARLVRKGLDPARSRTFAGEDGFRFRHILIRDAAYESMPKALRAQLHSDSRTGSRRGA